MPRRVVSSDGTRFEHAEYDLPDLGPTDVRVGVELAAPKHGTEGHALDSSALSRKRWDPALRLFVPASPDAGPVQGQTRQHAVGNTVVGTVVEAGAGVTRWSPGDRVFGYGPIQEVVQADQAHWRPMSSLSPADALCVDPAHVAFVAVRDGNIRIGDTVAVFGLGAIGLLAVQVARQGGARRVYAVDPSALRRACAVENGADAAFDPVACDVGLEIKLATGGAGVDVSMETSGNGRALHESIRCIRQCGTVVHVPWGPSDCSALRLDEEFHLNRPTIVGSQAWSGWANADRSHPLWTHERAFDAAIELFEAGLVTGDPIVKPIVGFEEAPSALCDLFRGADRAIKVGVRFP